MSTWHQPQFKNDSFFQQNRKLIPMDLYKLLEAIKTDAEN